MSQRLDLVLGFAAATISATIVCGALMVAFVAMEPLHDIDNVSQHLANVFLMSMVIGLPIIALCALLIGLPVHAALSQRGIVDLLAYLFAGIISGGAAGIAFVALLFRLEEGMLPGLALGGSGGVAASFVWWATVVKPRRNGERG